MPRLAGRYIRLMRLEMSERGFTLVDTPSFFDDGRFRRIKSSMTLLPSQGILWWKFPQLARYGCWLERLLGTTLPEEPLALAALEFRHEPAGTEAEEVDRLHADGSYLRAVYTLYGPTTVYRDGDAERSVPCGRTLLMTAMDRARALGVSCTLHRRPGDGLERAVIVCSLVPRPKGPQSANGYRRAGLAHRSRRGR
jgi:hypothetical protein